MLKDMLKKNYKFILLAVIALIGIFGVSYAFFEYYGTNKNSQLIFGNIYLKLDEGTSTLSVSNLFPETKEEARERTDNTLTFSIKGLNTTENKDIWYEIMLTEGDDEEGKVRFNPEDLVFDLIEVDADGNETLVVDALSFPSLNGVSIWTNTVPHNVTTEINQTYKLRVWLNENVTISDTNPNATYKASDFKSMYTNIKIAVSGDFYEDSYLKGYVYYDAGDTDLPMPSSTPFYSTNERVVLSNTTPANSGMLKFIGWATSKDGDAVYQPGDTINLNDFDTNKIYLYPVTVEKNTAELLADRYTLSSADRNGTRYITGDNPNNYLWYSGKMWRIVSINSDGTIKLVTQGNMTSIAWSIETGTADDGTTRYNTIYENSQIHNWLKNEFLPTLEPSVLADSTWDYTTYASATATKAPLSAYVEGEKVGLLTIYDYYKVRNGTDSNFLNNGYVWWIMSPKTDSSSVWGVHSSGSASSYGPTSSNGVRPSVNLKSDIQIIVGDGTRSNPYVIEGDKATGEKGELLSSRISGEYINFNDVLYRIVGTEEIEGKQLTKITMADYSLNKNTLTTSLTYASSSTSSLSQGIFSPTYGIGLYLEEWYQADSTSEIYATTYIKDNYKAMIAVSSDGVIWYIGPTSGIGNDYTLSKTGTPVSSTIGLGYYGEMFSSQFGNGFSSSTATWLITIHSGSYVRYVDSRDRSFFDISRTSSGVRPSMYLKSDVKIVSGSGMQYDPYFLSQ